jgi:riboflavin kinase/FMN adenylyltransferase
LREAGAADVRTINFTKEFAKKSADEFIEQILVGELKSEYVVIGENFSFGHKAEGNPEYLKSISKKYGFEVEIVKLQEERGSVISSTRIRNLIFDGDIERANQLLTRKYFLRGPVVHGEKRGREIGYPTANIGCAKAATIPADGIYAGYLTVGEERWPAAISIGTNPTFEGFRARQVEAYAVDQVDLNLYDQAAKLEFTHRLRDTLKFDGLQSLLAQMKLDCDQVRQLTKK